jgi:peroxiredoxin
MIGLVAAASAQNSSEVGPQKLGAVAAKPREASAGVQQKATIRGRIEGFRHVATRGAGKDQQQRQQERQTLIKVRLNDGRFAIIALGPKSDLDSLGLQRNDFITAEGRAGIVEGVPALVASNAEVNGQRVSIRQSSVSAERQVNGQPVRERASRNDQAVIDADARALMEKVRKAYQDLRAVQLGGTVSTHIEIGATVVKTSLGFTSSYEAPNKFRHDTAEMLIGSTGDQSFVFNKRSNNYMQQQVRSNQSLTEALPAAAITVLHTQNPSLLGAMLPNPLERVLQSVARVEKLDDAVVENQRYPQLVLRGAPGHGPISVLIDPETNLIRRATVDLREQIEHSGAREGVRQATTVIDYTLINTQPSFEEGRFAWQAPARASDVAQQRDSEQQASQGLVGRDAPGFELTSLDGRRVSLADQRGKVVVLDFWASWCPPCEESLPHLGRIYRDEQQDGVVVFAINVGEERDRVSSYVQMKNIALPVLLDPEGKVAEQYSVRGIPKTVVIGKDGKVTDVFSGLGADSYEEIRASIAKASSATTSAAGSTSAPTVSVN